MILIGDVEIDVIEVACVSGIDSESADLLVSEVTGRKGSTGGNKEATIYF